jgi:HD superfamily phosphohydrolase
MPKEKIMRDNIHGYIKLTELESEIIQLPVFNRLHRIRQSSFAFMVYPTAQGTRFAHSVGTMKVASDIAEEILKNLSYGDKESILCDMKAQDFIQIARLAGLLHDIGHGPFSHTSERILAEALKKVSPNEYDEGCRLWGRVDFPVHEFYTYKLIKEGQDLAELLEKNGPSNCKQIICDVITHRSRNSNISQEALNLLQQIITSQLDADKMDYLLRDAYTSGVGYGQIDIQRIILSMRVMSTNSGYRLAILERGLSAVEDMVDARFKMFKWLYHHHMVVLMDVLLEKAIATLVKEKILEPQELHWKTFDKGLTDDATITYLLSKEILCNRKQSFQAFLGLLDRRFAPVSLIKRPEDFEKICKDISKDISSRLGIRYDYADLKGAVENVVRSSTFEKDLEDELRDRSSTNAALQEVEVLVGFKPRPPYSPISRDPILIVTEDGSLIEIAALSQYIKNINAAWEAFPTLYVGYVLPGRKKSDIKDDLKQSIREALIASIVKSIAKLIQSRP